MQAGVDTRYVQTFEDNRSSTSVILVDGRGERLIVGSRDVDMPSGTHWLPLERIEEAGVVLADLRWLEGARVAFEAARKAGVPTVLDADLGGRRGAGRTARADRLRDLLRAGAGRVCCRGGDRGSLAAGGIASDRCTPASRSAPKAICGSRGARSSDFRHSRSTSSTPRGPATRSMARSRSAWPKGRPDQGDRAPRVGHCGAEMHPPWRARRAAERRRAGRIPARSSPAEWGGTVDASYLHR